MDLPAAADPVATLFAEELGLLLEVAPEHEAEVLRTFMHRLAFWSPRCLIFV